MKLRILFLSLFITISSLHYSTLAHEPEEGGDYFTLHMQEILFELGCLDKVTGVNDYHSIEAIKAFQKKAEIKVDGLIGKETFEKIMLREVTCEDTDLSFTDSLEISTSTKINTDNDSTNTSSIEDAIIESLEKKYIVVGGNCSYSVVEVSENDSGYLSGMTLSKALITRDEYNTWRCITTIESSSSNSVQSRLAGISSTSYAVTFGGTTGDFPSNVVVDSLGNAYITGDFQNTVNFGSGNITSSGGKDIFIAKFDTTGSLEWVKTYGDSSFDRGLDIAIDSSDNIYVTGYFIDTINFGGGNVTVTDPSSGGSDLFVLKLNSSGEFQWVYTVGGSNNDNGKGIDVDSSGNVYISGIFKDTVNFGGGDITSYGNFDIFVLKLNSSGVFQWVYHAGGTGNDQAYPISVDTNGNVLVAGYFFDTANFTPASCTSKGSADIFVLKLTASGLLNFIRCFGSSSVDYPWGVDFDSAGNAYITGGFSNTINFDCGNTTSSGSQDIFVMKLNSSGNCQWVYTVGDSDMDFGWALETDSSNNSYITGYFQDTVNFGGGNITSAGNRDVFVLKLNSSGVFQWVYTAGGTEDDYSYGLDIDSSGNIYAVGSFQSTINFGGGNITSEGVYDVFAVKLNSSGQYSD
tara:strand:+ start:55 stop:1953 length:1899 start_codon:yes stop_codon:yes gene_type:complete